MVAMIADLTPDQLKIRRTRVGASEVAAICGLSSWAGPLDIYRIKKGLQPARPDTAATAYGKAMESGARELYAYQTGRRVTTVGTIIHPRHDLVCASPDGIVDDLATLQIKCPLNWNGWGESGTHDFPDMHWMQITWEMAAAQMAESDLVALLRGETEVRIYPACRFDDTFFHTLLEKVQRFWHDHIVADVPPPIGGSRADADYIKERFPREKHLEYILDDSPDIAQLARDYDACSEACKEYDSRKADLRNKLAARCGDAVGISGGWGSVSFKSTRRSSLDKESLFASFRISPADVAAHTSESFSRTLRVSLKKGQ